MSYTARVIPCLLLQNETLVKTVRFSQPVYVGDPANVLSIFSMLEVDEIVLLDIDATRQGRVPDVDLLARLTDECIIPLAYGGGITSVAQIGRILEVGCEKVIVNTALAADPDLVGQAADAFGSQAVVASVDARTAGGGYEAFVRGGTQATGFDPVGWSRRAQDLGAGEILLTSIDRDGTMEGYDLALIEAVAKSVTIPVIACGGAGGRQDLAEAVNAAGASAAAAGSIFVFQGRNRSVLINFPTRRQLIGFFEPTTTRGEH
ncbi:MAG: AglZ/HisF2 family acetamidino modification protein [Acidimicrobiia bacterium]